MYETLQMYAKIHDIQAPSPERYSELSIGQGSSCGDPFNTEEQLDVESSYDMAPMANHLVVGGDSCDNGDYGLQALYDADLAILNGANGHPLARIASNSWEGGDETISANLLKIEHDYLIKAAAEGVTMLFSSGDSSGVKVPSSDPYATAVGATTLGIGQENPRCFETGWSTGISAAGNGKWIVEGEQGAGGGGASLQWQQPAYQDGVVPDSLAVATGNRAGVVRTVPDISAVGDPFTGMAVGMLSLDAKGNVTGYFEESIGGTSLATPLVAAIVADAEQGSRAFGFINPALYKLARKSPCGLPRPEAAVRKDRGQVSRCRVRPGHVRRDLADRVRRPELVDGGLHRAGNRAWIRHHDRRRHPERAAVHHRLAPPLARFATATGPGTAKPSQGRDLPGPLKAAWASRSP